MVNFKTLAGDTVIYGGTTIFVRLLNWLLMPYYINNMSKVQYGYVIEVYSYIAIFLVLLTYGFETSFFRFSKENSIKKVFTTSLSSIISTSTLFVFLLFLFLSNYSLRGDNSLFNKLLLFGGIIASFDAITSIIFAKLRFENRSLKFAILKIVNICILLFLNILLLLICPYLYKNFPEYKSLVGIIYKPGNEAFYVLISNLITSLVIFILLIPEVYKSRGKVDIKLLKSMFKYSLPILVVGITGMVNLNIDKTLIPVLIGGTEGYEMLAIYGANFKIGVLMAMFTQSFRLAFEPFFFKNHNEVNKSNMYSDILLYFVLFGLLIFLGVTFFIDIINLLLTSTYIQGNVVIPYILIAQLLSGIYFTLSVWYKVSDKTIYGAYMGIFGSILAVVGNLLLIPLYGYLGSAITSVICFGAMVLVSIFLGKKHYFITYNWKKILKYALLTSLIFVLGKFILPTVLNSLNPELSILHTILSYMLRIGLIIVFLWIIYKNEVNKLKLKRNVS